MDLNSDEQFYVGAPTASDDVMAIVNYLGDNPTADQKLFAKEHLQLMRTDDTYKQFYYRYVNAKFSYVNPPIMWWDSADFLGDQAHVNPTNLEIAAPYIASMGLYDVANVNMPTELSWLDKNTVKSAISSGVTALAELAHDAYQQVAEVAQNHSTLMAWANYGIARSAALVAKTTNFNQPTMTYQDLIKIWLFELGNTDTYNFISSDNVTIQLIPQEGVVQTRNQALAEIRNGNLNGGFHQWQYGTQQFYNDISEGNIVTAFTGTYTTSYSITDNHNGSYTVHFVANNISGWESATRLRKSANVNDPAHQGIIPNKLRGAGLHLGGNLTETWSWTEILTP